MCNLGLLLLLLLLLLLWKYMINVHVARPKLCKLGRLNVDT
jgi:hypothetical protein